MPALLYSNLKSLSEDKHVPKELWNEDAISIVDICEGNTFYQAVKECRPIVGELNLVFRRYGLPTINLCKKSRAFEKEISDFAKKCGATFKCSEPMTQIT